MAPSWQESCARIGFRAGGKRLYFRIPGVSQVLKAPIGGNQVERVAYELVPADSPFPIPEVGTDLFRPRGQIWAGLHDGTYELPPDGAIPS